MYINSIDSTNTQLQQWLRTGEWHGGDLSDAAEEGSEGILYTFDQTAGRGQAGNGWESEKGKNLLLTAVLLDPGVRAEDQFRVQMYFSLVIRNFLVKWIGKKYAKERLTIKWPNDIYFDNKKLVGILVESSLLGGELRDVIMGAGINVNQTRWIGNAPNPVSLKLITGVDHDLSEMLLALRRALHDELPLLHCYDELKCRYMSLLYRREGFHLYMEREVSVEPTMPVMGNASNAFEAQLVDITNQGKIVLRLPDETIRTYHFKQIRFVL